MEVFGYGAGEIDLHIRRLAYGRVPRLHTDLVEYATYRLNVNNV